jgi:hypothetical protein
MKGTQLEINVHAVDEFKDPEVGTAKPLLLTYCNIMNKSSVPFELNYCNLVVGHGMLICMIFGTNKYCQSSSKDQIFSISLKWKTKFMSSISEAFLF